MKKVIILFVLVLTTVLANAQTYNITTSYNSATINFTSPTTESTSIKVFEDTVVFREDFSKMLSIIPTSKSFNAEIPVPLPNSYTIYPGCKARNLRKIHSVSDSIGIADNGVFQTPFLDLSKNNGEYRIKFSITPKTKYDPREMYVNAITTNGTSTRVFSKTNKLSLNKKATIDYDATGGTNGIRLEFNPNKTSILSDIEISQKPVYIIDSNTVSTSNDFTINNLKESTKYLVIIDDTIHLSFKTNKIIDSVNVNNITRTSATINVSQNTTSTNNKIIIKKLSSDTTRLADDLIISEHISNTSTTNGNESIEIYNGTGKDICLKEYKLSFWNRNAGGNSPSLDSLTFNEDDSIMNNKTIVVTYSLNNYNSNNDTKFYTYSKDIRGNGGLALLHNNDTIDIFGTFSTADHTTDVNGWTYGNIHTSKSILRRDSNIFIGVKSNPDTGFCTLNQWKMIDFSGQISSDSLAGLGVHTMSGALADDEQGTVIVYDNLTDSVYNVTGLEPNTVYQAIVVLNSGNNDSIVSKKVNFRTERKIIKRTHDGSWNCDTCWDNDVPTIEDIAYSNGYDINIADTDETQCYELYLQDSANKRTNLKNEGTLKIGNYYTHTQMNFKGYSNNADSSDYWYLVGLPIISNQRDTMNNVFNIQSGDANDLYYWKDTTITGTDNNSYTGWWMNYKDTTNQNNFFDDENRGYLVAYKNDTTLTFKGLVFDSDSCKLLNNASLSTPPQDDTIYRGYHLTYNRFPFEIGLGNIQRHSCTIPIVYNQQSGTYVQMDNTIKLSAYEGFVTQVTNTNNSLTIAKEEQEQTNQKSVNANNTSWLTIRLTGPKSDDKTQIAFEDDKTTGLDWQSDNYKLFGMGNSSEIYTVFEGKRFMANSFDFQTDSLLIQIGLLIKTQGDYTLAYDYAEDGLIGCLLIDNQTDDVVNDFFNNPQYHFFADENMDSNRFSLKIFQNTGNISNINKASDYITLQQDGKQLSFFSNEKINNIEVYSVSGVCLQSSKQNKITLKTDGVFFVRVSTNTQSKVFKVISLF